MSYIRGCTMLVVAKPVTWTLESNRRRKTGSIYNDTLSCIGKPRGLEGVCDNVTKKLSHSIAYYAISAKTTLGYFYPTTPPPLPG